MKIVKPSFQIEECPTGDYVLKKLEQYIRTAYKSEDRITNDSAKKIVSKLLNQNPPHESVIEHMSATVRIICDRGVTHEIVRHRLASYTQESTRYCNYSKGRFGGEITVIHPCFFPINDRDVGEDLRYDCWLEAMRNAEKSYLALLNLGASPQEARSVLPNSLKTEIVMTANLREWRHFFKLRASKRAHPQMQEIAQPMLDEFKKRIPVIFDDINYSD